MVDAKDVMKLRRETGSGVNDCKKALGEAEGDFENAKDLLRKWGGKIAEKKAGRETTSGLVGCYLHPTPETARVGVMVQFNCETDFVAKNEKFQAFLKQISQHIAATSPSFLSREEIPEDVINRERTIYEEQAEGKPEAAIQKIVEGKLEKYYSERCLLDQAFVFENSKTVSEMLTDLIATIGENMKIARFSRFEIGG